MFKEKKSFFNKLIDMVNIDHDDDEYYEEDADDVYEEETDIKDCEPADNWIEEENSEGQLTIDMCQTADDIIIRTMVAGVKPEDLDISINREIVTIKGERHKTETEETDDYFHEELYWGAFSRTILLPQEIDVDNTNASVQNGLLSITLPKIDSKKTQRLDIDVLE